MRSFQQRNYNARDPLRRQQQPHQPQYQHQPTIYVPTPSPLSTSSASSIGSIGSSASSVSSVSSSSSCSSVSRVQSMALPMTAQVDDESELWSSIRLASSPPSSQRSAVPQYTRQSQHYQHHHKQQAAPRNAYAASPPLVIDDFSHDRASHIPSVAQPSHSPPPLAPPAASATKAKPPLKIAPSPTTWSFRRPAPPPPSPSLPRTQSLQETSSSFSSASSSMVALPSSSDITIMDHRVFIARDQWVHHKDRRACTVCDKEFSMLLRKKHSCRMCGDVVCSRCSLFKSVKLPGVVGESKARVCSRCFLQYRQRFLQKTLSADDVVVAAKFRGGSDEPQQEVANEDDNVDDNNHDGSYDHDYDWEYDDVLPSAEDVMRRTAAKVGMFGAAAMGGAAETESQYHHHHRQPEPVSLLAPELMETMCRESSSLAAATMLQQQQQQPQPSPSYSSRAQYNSRGPSMLLLSPTSSYELLDMRLFDVDRTQSFSSSVSTVSSSLSSLSSMSSLSSASMSSASMSAAPPMGKAMEDELAAAIRARELEKEVEESRERIQELERRMQDQEHKKAELSLEQQSQLREARELIAQLQEQLTLQEQNARDAAMTRDSICLSNLRQQQQHPYAGPETTPGGSSNGAPGPRTRRSNSVEAESEALRQKLRLLERQLQQAGINVAEVIPYAVAKQRITEISRRMAEISDEEAAMKLQMNVRGVAQLRREYYVLEQDMERFHTALLMSDEYMEEQASRAREWELLHAQANTEALRCVRSALPVDISKLSEQTLRSMVTPSGKHMSADLARRFKRTNVLQLLRVAPQTIVRMHPSVIESYRTTGLALVERRALYAALQSAGGEWQKQSRDENAQKKAAWFCKLKDAFVQALLAYDQHIAKHHNHHTAGGMDTSACPFIGKMCVLRAEQAVTQLYGAHLGFPEGAEFLTQEIIKSDPEGAGEKALQEAQSHVRATRSAAKTIARQSALKRHYGLRNIRFVTMALAAMDEVDAAIDRLRELDEQAGCTKPNGISDTDVASVWWGVCERIVSEARELAAHLAKRAGICLTGKRDAAKDAADTRSIVEASLAQEALCFLGSLLDDVALASKSSTSQLKNALPRIRELMGDLAAKNDELCTSQALAPVAEEGAGEKGSTAAAIVPRVAWKDHVLEMTAAAPTTMETKSVNKATPSPASTEVPSTTVKTAPRPAPLLPRGSALLDAIRAKRNAADAADESSAVRDATLPAPVSSVASIASEKTHASPVVSVPVHSRVAAPVVAKAVEDTHKPMDLLAAIRARKAKAAENQQTTTGDQAPATA